MDQATLAETPVGEEKDWSISEVVYGGRLEGVPELARQATDFGTGLRFRAVEHLGNASASGEEAMCLAFVVASPRLLESRARTIEQMRLINALCRLVDLAGARHG